MQREQLLARLRGAFPAAVTPMTAQGDVDHEALAENLRWMCHLGLAGVLLLGSTGEQVHLSEFERALVMEIGRRGLPDDQVLLVGAGQPSTRLTIEETKRAAEAGADAALVVTPNYYQPAMGAEALTTHYAAVAEASPLPILLYSVPGITGITLPPSVVASLAPHPNVVGMKNSGSDPHLAAAYREAAAGEPFVILAGSVYAAPGWLLMGWVDGVILAAANVLPERSVALVQAAQQGDVAAVREHGAALRAVNERVGRFGIAGWKAGLMARGRHGGAVRGPLRNLAAADWPLIEAAVRELAGEPR